MSEKDKQMPKRFFIQGTVDIHKRLQHLAVDLDDSAEKLAGKLLAEFIPLVEAEVRSGKRSASAKPKAERR
jgi:hypothetical protein